MSITATEIVAKQSEFNSRVAHLSAQQIATNMRDLVVLLMTPGKWELAPEGSPKRWRRSRPLWNADSYQDQGNYEYASDTDFLTM